MLWGSRARLLCGVGFTGHPQVPSAPPAARGGGRGLGFGLLRPDARGWAWRRGGSAGPILPARAPPTGRCWCFSPSWALVNVCVTELICVWMATGALPRLEFAVVEIAELGKRGLKAGQFPVQQEGPSRTPRLLWGHQQLGCFLSSPPVLTHGVVLLRAPSGPRSSGQNLLELWFFFWFCLFVCFVMFHFFPDEFTHWSIKNNRKA